MNRVKLRYDVTRAGTVATAAGGAVRSRRARADPRRDDRARHVALSRHRGRAVGVRRREANDALTRWECLRRRRDPDDESHLATEFAHQILDGHLLPKARIELGD